MRNKCLLFKSLSLWYLLWHPEQTKTDVRGTSKKNLFIWATKNDEMKLVTDVNQLASYRAINHCVWGYLFCKTEINVFLLKKIHMDYYEQDSLHYYQFL